MGHSNQTMTEIYIRKKEQEPPDVGEIMTEMWFKLYKKEDDEKPKIIEASFPDYIYDFFDKRKESI